MFFRRFKFALSVIFYFATAAGAIALVTQKSPSKQDIWRPSSGHRQIAIWPAAPPHLVNSASAESVSRSKRIIGGKTFLGVYNITKPTITLYPPKGHNSGVAILVFPGGGYSYAVLSAKHLRSLKHDLGWGK